jgi:hypothetical protein
MMKERGSKEDGDQTLVEDSKDDSHENLDEVEVSANVSIDKDDTFKSAESSLTSDKGDADDTVEQIEETPKLTRKGRAPAKETTDNLIKATAVPTATIGIEILAASDGEEDEEDDIFSDASSVASVNLSKLPKGAILDNSSEESADDEIFVKSQSPPKQKTAPVKKSTKAKDASSIRSSSSPPIPSTNLSTRSSRSSVVSSPTPRSSRSSRSSRTTAASEGWGKTPLSCVMSGLRGWRRGLED